jgi:hypothetical protein
MLLGICALRVLSPCGPWDPTQAAKVAAFSRRFDQMARSHEDMERYILSSPYVSEQVAEGTWLLRDPDWGGAQIVVQHTEPLMVFRAKLFELPELPDAAKAKLFALLLELNATEMLQGAYALEGNNIVAVEVMQAENLDENEFLAAVDTLSLALSGHRDEILALLAA